MKRRTSNLVSLIVTALLVLIWTQVASANSELIANAGEDLSIYLGDTAYLHGNATDPDDGPIVVWDWTLELKPAGSTATLVQPNTPDPYLNPDVVGDYWVSLRVSDGTTISALNLVIIHVDPNQPLVKK